MITQHFLFPGGKTKALTLSYDDGVKQDKRFAEILRKHGIKCTFNINGGRYLPGDPFSKTVGRCMSAQECLALYQDDLFEVACHGLHHPFLEQCDTAVATYEVLEDRRVLESIFGKRIQGMAYPYGTYNDRVVDILRCCGILYSRTVESTHKFDMPSDWLRMPATCHHRDPQLMELVNKFCALPATPRVPRLFYLWGHTYEFDDNDNWDVIETFAEKMGGRDDIFYGTNMEIYNAWHDYLKLQSTADGQHIFNPTCRSVWIGEMNGTVYEIKPGQTLHLK